VKEVYRSMNNKGHVLGAHFESKIQTALDTIKKDSNYRLWFKRYYDTKSAGGNLLPPQPADFQVATEMGVWLVEAKSSFKKESLASCLGNAVEAHQAVSHKMWNRIKKPSFFLFFCAETEEVELWDGEHVALTRIEPHAKLHRTDSLLVCPLGKLKTVFNEVFMNGQFIGGPSE